jgi:tetratricopeptide (TPR) repeat protein
MDSTPLGGAQWQPFVEADAFAEIEKAIAVKGAHVGWFAMRGRWREALAGLDAKAPARTADPGRHRFYRGWRLTLLVLGGASQDEVWREVEEQFRLGGPDFLTYSGWLLAVSGDVERASRMVGFEAPFGPSRMYEAVRRWKSGERERALRDLDTIFGYASTFYRGQILAELGRDREAGEAFRRFRRAPNPPVAFSPGLLAANYSLSLYHEAVSLDRLGERDEARRLLDRLLRLWNRADASQPMLREAKALRKRLAAAPR